jgi:hypothetical protein
MFNELLYIERYVRWCERKVSELITHLPLDLDCIETGFFSKNFLKIPVAHGF